MFVNSIIIIFSCKTIFTQLPRLVTPVDVDYDLTAREKFLKNSKNTYYDNYIKSLNKTRKSKMPMNDFEDYDITDRKKILLEHVKNKELITCYLKSNNGNGKQSLFVPMTPYQIQNIVVTPKFIQLGRVIFIFLIPRIYPIFNISSLLPTPIAPTISMWKTKTTSPSIYP